MPFHIRLMVNFERLLCIRINTTTAVYKKGALTIKSHPLLVLVAKTGRLTCQTTKICFLCLIFYLAQVTEKKDAESQRTAFYTVDSCYLVSWERVQKRGSSFPFFYSFVFSLTLRYTSMKTIKGTPVKRVVYSSQDGIKFQSGSA